VGQEPNTTARIVYAQYATLLPASSENGKYKDLPSQYVSLIIFCFRFLKVTILHVTTKHKGFSGEKSCDSFILG
jgi:hypothetical protein